jgi:cytochrome c5
MCRIALSEAFPRILGRRGPVRAGVGVIAVGYALALAPGCAPPRERPAEVTLGGVDSVLAELGGAPTASLERGQRWRMISSIGAGLPPSIFKPEDLPDPRSRGAGLLRVYCVQCHWLPAPQMHSAAEWPILLRRMEMRARTLEHRMGGPLTEGLVGEILMAGYTHTALPSRAELDTMEAYLKAHALLAARPGELTPGPGAALFVEMCSFCHEAPSPRSHTAAGWQPVVQRMKANMVMMGVPPMTDAQSDTIVTYLRARAARAP